MAGEQSLIIVGASARAAAFSALRAGLRPWCLDLFGDVDLRSRCPVTVLDHAMYPRSIAAAMRQAPPGPWMYTGGLENHPRLVAGLTRERPLWGNDEEPLRRVRSPKRLSLILRGAGLSYPGFRSHPPDVMDADVWLEKPYASAGGTGIRVWRGEPAPKRRVFYQRFLNGPSVSAIYIGWSHRSELLGVTQQLVGERWLHARRFSYCGSIGPLQLSSPDLQYFSDVGEVLVREAGLRGLFGVDFILHEGRPWVVEVNPRYTASVEVLEHALGEPVFYLHALAFDRTASVPEPIRRWDAVGKAILFARESFVFPAEGPWMETLRARWANEVMPKFADIPAPGTLIQRGWPVLTFFTMGNSPSDIQMNLYRIATELDRCFDATLGTL